MTLREFILEASGEKIPYSHEKGKKVPPRKLKTPEQYDVDAADELARSYGEDSKEWERLTEIANKLTNPEEIERIGYKETIEKNFMKFRKRASDIISDEEAKSLGGWKKVFSDIASY